MNTAEIKAAIDQHITNAVADDSITPTILGERLKEMIDAVKPYKSLVFLVTINGGGVSENVLMNDFGAVTFTNPSTGVLRVGITGNQITVNTKVVTALIVHGSTPYVIVPALASAHVDLNLQLLDGTQNSTPFITNQLIEIRVYN